MTKYLTPYQKRKTEMTKYLTPYQKRCREEEKMRHFFTETCNTGGLQEVLKKHGLRLCGNGYIKDDGCVNKLFEQYLKDVVLPDIEKELGIIGIKVHKKPSSLTSNLFKWYKTEIKQE